MRFRADHDLHLHSSLSLCSGDPLQTPENLLRYGQKNGFADLCLTDHCWDETVPGASDWYVPQNPAHLEQALPLPQGGGVRFHFGCETELDRRMRLGLSPERFGRFELIIIPVNHLHMTGFTLNTGDLELPRRAERIAERLRAVLEMDLPFEKVGLAHLTCPLMAPPPWENHLAVLDRIGDDTFRELFGLAQRRGAGIELNLPFGLYAPADRGRVLRPYRIARACGCKFYLGSDAHHPAELERAKANFEALIDALGLEESDRFSPFAPGPAAPARP